MIIGILLFPKIEDDSWGGKNTRGTNVDQDQDQIWMKIIKITNFQPSPFQKNKKEMENLQELQYTFGWQIRSDKIPADLLERRQIQHLETLMAK